MRIVTLIVAALASVAALVTSRRAASAAKNTAKVEKRLSSPEHAPHQRAGQVNVPKMPKIKRRARL